MDEIVVGTDGSTHGRAAVRWAARQARRDDVHLRVVHAYDFGWLADRFAGAVEYREGVDAHARRIAAEAERAARETAPGLPVCAEVVVGETVPALLGRSSARLVVVGNRGRGGFASLLLGSVGQRVAAHADRPVVIVRGRSDADPGAGPVVVGTDGSPGGEQAVGLAFAEAAARGATLLAVRAHSSAGSPPVPDLRRLAEAEEAALAETLAPWRRRYPHTPVQAAAVQEGAARMLVELSHTATLVVVGHHGTGRTPATLLGTVALQLIHHADCPVLISRP
ncbi:MULTISPECIES: universal stress protein [Catenuloplanes]|uniref:Nucleotide-binding universal stress UspA family protein n=1 Tax=Catenuloplanes niger TaxID=587534 RepID=A0AAE4CXM2_9ACTN|nr:universal stress protein [Catenuloplanes niger]MDR7327642.1 nucleotide-binding universal stress UspA family protein [Catenuloplanes niger]